MTGEYYVDKLKNIEKNQEDFLILKELYEKKYNNEYNLNDLINKDVKEIRTFYKEFIFTIKERKSCISLEDIKKILLISEIGNGLTLQAFKEYTCKQCGHTEMWHNYSVPDFCDKCREIKAKRIIDSLILEKINIKK